MWRTLTTPKNVEIFEGAYPKDAAVLDAVAELGFMPASEDKYYTIGQGLTNAYRAGVLTYGETADIRNHLVNRYGFL